MPARLAVVIPARDEAERLPATLEALARARRALAPAVEVVLVLVADNGSGDGTGAIAAITGRHLGLPLEVRRVDARGKAAALAAAMPAAAAHPSRPDWVLFMDADNATDLAEAARFDLAVPAVWCGSRTAPGALVRRPHGDSAARRAMSAAMRLLAARLVPTGVGDTQCGFKALPAPLAAPLFGALRDRSWVFDAELLALARRAGVPVREAGVRWTEMPGSKVRPLPDAVRSLRALLAIAWRLRRLDPAVPALIAAAAPRAA